MEFPELGKNCSWTNCKTNDFLPFECSHCHLIFCKDHFVPDVHHCAKVVNIISSGESTARNIKCSMEKCSTMDSVQMNCMKCNKHFCLTHRHHGCFDFTDEEIAEAKQKLLKPKEEFSKALVEAHAKIDENLEKSKKNAKSRQTALKVQLMRLKGKAIGQNNLPTEERVYFLVILPKSIDVAPKAVFLSKEWTVGRVIDACSSLCDVPNRNNEANARKLRLFRKYDGKQISSDITSKLDDLLKSGSLENGDSLILEFVDSSCNLNDYALVDY